MVENWKTTFPHAVPANNCGLLLHVHQRLLTFVRYLCNHSDGQFYLLPATSRCRARRKISRIVKLFFLLTLEKSAWRFLYYKLLGNSRGKTNEVTTECCQPHVLTRFIVHSTANATYAYVLYTMLCCLRLPSMPCVKVHSNLSLTVTFPA